MRARVAALAVMLAGAAPATAAAAPTVVTFGFDDGTTNQLEAAATLAEAGMKATFYVNSGNVGKTPEFMTWDDLTHLRDLGHEIGGHTTNHVNLEQLLATQGAEAVEAEVCEDRDAISEALELDVVSFAYPNGAYDKTDPTIRQIVAECGYTSARTTEGINPPTETQPACDVCAEPLPVSENRYFRTRALQLRTQDTDEEVIDAIQAAAEAGGGWLQLVLHDVCDGCGGGYEISPDELRTIVAWLQEHACEGYVVARVRDVIEDDIPDVPDCAPEPPPASGGGGGGAGGGGAGGGGGAPAALAPASAPSAGPQPPVEAAAPPSATAAVPTPLAVTLSRPRTSRSGLVTVSATVTAPGPVRFVRFLVNGRSVAVDRTAPYRLRWRPTPGRTARRLAITAEVVAADGTKASSTTRTLRVRARR